MIKEIQFDRLGTRYQLISNNQPTNFDWIFLPGGPGADSRYFKTLLDHLVLPGKVWFVDFPGNGDNIKEPNCPDYDFNQWDECLIETFNKFEHPILVGHSFGGMYPLLFPELENILKGFVMLSTAPCLWLDEAAKLAKENNITVLTDDMQQFEDMPNQNTFNKALLACLPYYFPSHTLEVGKAIIKELPFNYRAAVWWLRKANTINFSAKWVPMDVPTLILGGTRDYIVPISLFESDKRFHRNNITIKNIKHAGHFPWVENSKAVVQAFNDFQSQLQ